MSSFAASTGRSARCSSAPALPSPDPKCTPVRCGSVNWVPCLFVCSWEAHLCLEETHLIHIRIAPGQSQIRRCLEESRMVHISDFGSQQPRTTKSVWQCHRWWNLGVRLVRRLDHRINGRRSTDLQNKNSYLVFNPLQLSPLLYRSPLNSLLCKSAVLLMSPKRHLSKWNPLPPSDSLNATNPLWGFNIINFQSPVSRSNPSVIAEPWLRERQYDNVSWPFSTNWKAGVEEKL